VDPSVRLVEYLVTNKRFAAIYIATTEMTAEWIEICAWCRAETAFVQIYGSFRCKRSIQILTTWS